MWEIGPGTLKCVTASSNAGPLRDRIEAALREHVRSEDIRHLYGDVFVVYTNGETETVRDWLTPLLQGGGDAFVVEFESWSGSGPAADRAWLLRRGH